MQTLSNTHKLLQEIRHLTVYDRLNLITDIWDEIKEAQELETLAEEEKTLL